MGVKDNDWIEAFNRNGVVAARAVSHRIPEGHDHVPLPGQAPERPDLGGLGHARRHRELPDEDLREADA